MSAVARRVRRRRFSFWALSAPVMVLLLIVCMVLWAPRPALHPALAVPMTCSTETTLDFILGERDQLPLLAGAIESPPVLSGWIMALSMNDETNAWSLVAFNDDTTCVLFLGNRAMYIEVEE